MKILLTDAARCTHPSDIRKWWPPMCDAPAVAVVVQWQVGHMWLCDRHLAVIRGAHPLHEPDAPA